MKGTMSMILLACMMFMCFGSEFYDRKSNNRQSDMEKYVETRFSGKFFCSNYICLIKAMLFQETHL